MVVTMEWTVIIDGKGKDTAQWYMVKVNLPDGVTAISNSYDKKYMMSL